MTYKTTTLDTFVTLQRGFDLPAQDRIPGDIPIIAANGPVGFHNIAKVNTQCVVIGRSGSVGNPQLITGAFWPLNTTLFVKDFHGNSPTFVYYVLKTIDFKSFDAGGTVPTLNRNHLTQIEVPLLDLAHQESIGGVLRNLDLKIATNKALSKTQEEIAQTIFKSWFIDFDPVKAKMAGEKPEGMDAATAALFPDAMEESELGLIPKGWKAGTVGSICDSVVNGSTPLRTNSAFWSSDDISWFKTGELSDNFLFESKESIAQLALEKTSVKVLPRGSVLMAIYAAPTVGRLGILTKSASFNQACTGMVAKYGFGTPYLYLTLFNRRIWFNSLAIGAAQQNISKVIVEGCPALIASQDVHNAFLEITQPIFAQIEALGSQSNSLVLIRDSLLPRLISGELQIPDEMLAS